MRRTAASNTMKIKVLGKNDAKFTVPALQLLALSSRTMSNLLVPLALAPESDSHHLHPEQTLLPGGGTIFAIELFD